MKFRMPQDTKIYLGSYCIYFYSIYFLFGFYHKSSYAIFILCVAIMTWLSLAFMVFDALTKNSFSYVTERVLNPDLFSKNKYLRKFAHDRYRFDANLYIISTMIFSIFSIIFVKYRWLSDFTDWYYERKGNSTIYKTETEGKYTVNYYINGKIEYKVDGLLHHDKEAAVRWDQESEDIFIKLKIPEFYFQGQKVSESELQGLLMSHKLGNI